MTIGEKIKEILKQDTRKKLVFYFDADGLFQEELQEIEASGIQVIQVNQHYFALKYQLEMEQKGNPILDDGVGKNIASLQNKKMIAYEVLNAGQFKKYLNADW